MHVQRRFIMENDAFRSPIEIRPSGVIVYSSGFPTNVEHMRRVYARSNFRASVHALVDHDGFQIVMPLNWLANHSGRYHANEKFLGVMVCEPNPNAPQTETLRELTDKNLVQCLVFLCRYMGINPINASEVILFAGTAYANHFIAPEVLKSPWIKQKSFNKTGANLEDDEVFCHATSILRDVTIHLGDLNAMCEDDTEVIDTPLTHKGVDNILLFTGGPIFKSRGTSMCETRINGMSHCHLLEFSRASNHPYRVAFPDGTTCWVNRASLVSSSAGNVSLY